jgi:hypothetical protein
LAQPNLFGDSGLDVETSKINYRERKNNQNRGPNHAVSALTLWAIIWCFLSFY